MNQSKLERELHLLDDMIERVRQVRGTIKKNLFNILYVLDIY